MRINDSFDDPVKKNFFRRMAKKASESLSARIRSVTAFFKQIPSRCKAFFDKVKQKITDFYLTFKEGDIGVKMSYFVMGSGSFAHKRIGNGLTYLAVQLLYVFYMAFNGIGALKDFVTLGTEFSYTYYDLSGAGSLTEINVPGDNSMLCLLYGVVAVVVTITFVILYLSNIKSARATGLAAKTGQHVPTFRQDIRQLLDSKFYVLLLVVSLVGVVAFTVMPLIFMILIAFTSYDSQHPETSGFTWVWFQNFGKMLGTTGLGTTFFPVLGWTLLWAVCATFLNYFLGVGLALLINNKRVRGKKLWRTFFVLTIAIPQFTSLLLMRNLLGQYGPVMNILTKIGLERVDWFADKNAARLIIVLVNLWIGIPYSMLITSGILMNIPSDLYESARIDGAGPFRMFQKITLPYILFVTGPYLITQFIGNINNFNVIFLLTGGGPFGELAEGTAGSTSLLVTWLYQITTVSGDYNIASSVGILTFAVCSVIALITFKNTSSVKQEGDFK